MNDPRRGHRSLPHTADLRIEAWAPTRDDCLAEAVAALRDGIADTGGATARRTVEIELAAEDDEDALVAVLDEVIFLLDTEEAVPLDAETLAVPGGLRLRLLVVPATEVDLWIAPKAVTLNGLAFESAKDHWRCIATVDV